ncbi:MAG TPA: DUF86 domain-containing protein [Chitinophagales bacterium]|nr:DUF86 domain-containing protein [Chitinophagales bacterium]HRK26565.1 DUF86 domain-containing protein [Chitinophagales bacterium]
MNNRYYKSLQEILDSIERITEYVGLPLDYFGYANNKLVQQAVERNFEIIGEAVKRLLEIEPTVPISNTRKIINMRNKISHGYDEVELVQVWAVIVNHLPTLKQEVEILIKQVE